MKWQLGRMGGRKGSGNERLYCVLPAILKDGIGVKESLDWMMDALDLPRWTPPKLSARLLACFNPRNGAPCGKLPPMFMTKPTFPASSKARMKLLKKYRRTGKDGLNLGKIAAQGAKEEKAAQEKEAKAKKEKLEKQLKAAKDKAMVLGLPPPTMEDIIKQNKGNK